MRGDRSGSASSTAADSSARPQRSCRPPRPRSRRPWRKHPAPRPVGWVRACPVQTEPNQRCVGEGGGDPGVSAVRGCVTSLLCTALTASKVLLGLWKHLMFLCLILFPVWFPRLEKRFPGTACVSESSSPAYPLPSSHPVNLSLPRTAKRSMKVAASQPGSQRGHAPHAARPCAGRCGRRGPREPERRAFPLLSCLCGHAWQHPP